MFGAEHSQMCQKHAYIYLAVAWSLPIAQETTSQVVHNYSTIKMATASLKPITSTYMVCVYEFFLCWVFYIKYYYESNTSILNI